ncbi:MAG: desulfoferrodoxin family protein [Eubacteriales bacterium]|nr:desulfoferrodoxin family protein [Eubacteriales bacterium]
MKFFRCSHCGNLVYALKDAGVPMHCCGEEMKELTANTTDAATEKHVPVVTVDGAQVHVAVGSVAHPMLPEHFIQWIALETDQGVSFKELAPEEAPAADFALLSGEKAVAAYEYCNLHGLWKKEI